MAALRIRNLGKAYRRYARKRGRLLEWLGAGPQHELRWVLRDLTFDVERGESVGVIGANGAALHARESHISANYDWWDRSLVFQVVPGKGPVAIGLVRFPVDVGWMEPRAATLAESGAICAR